MERVVSVSMMLTRVARLKAAVKQKGSALSENRRKVFMYKLHLLISDMDKPYLEKAGVGKVGAEDELEKMLKVSR